MERFTVWMARVGFLTIAACTFGLSFNAISDVARETGAVSPELAWIVPLAVDGMIVTATAVLWTESLAGRGWHMFPLLSIVGPAILSMWSNIAHASGDSLLAQVLAAVPPAGLILSLELVAWQIRRERRGPSPRATRDWQQTVVPYRAPVQAPATNSAPGRVPEPRVTASRPTEPAADLDRQPTAARAPQAATDGHRRDPASMETVIADDTGRITLQIPQGGGRGKEVWSQIIEAVQNAGIVPSQRDLAEELNVSRSRVQNAIRNNRDEWERLRQSVEEEPDLATTSRSQRRR